MSKIKEQRRQGDIFFIKVDEIPDNAEVDPKGVIAEGEVTGHQHKIKPGSKSELLVVNDSMFVNSLEKEYTEIIHPEHNTIHLSPGKWSVTRQQENTPFGWRQVAD